MSKYLELLINHFIKLLYKEYIEMLKGLSETWGKLFASVFQCTLWWKI